MTIFDLSHPIRASTPVYPGDPRVQFTDALTIAHDGAQVTELHLGTHTGTHLDAPSHIVPGGRTVDQLELQLLHGPATILRLRNAADAQQAIQRRDLLAIPDHLSSIVCIATDWDRFFHHSLREYHPYIEASLAELLWDRGARVLGVDTLSPDATAHNVDAFHVHEFWLGNDGVIVENLRGLTRLPQQVHMSFLPLPLEELDGSPVRAIAWIT